MGSVSSKLGTTIVALWLALACGGSQPGAASPDIASSPGDPDGDARGTESNGEGEEQSAPVAPSCDDGTCFRCGDGFCPKGFYCDKDAQGGAACGWLPSCADEASCSCVKQAFGGSCSCEEASGGVMVDCD